MKKINVKLFLVLLFIVTGCSETSGLFGTSSDGSDPFANISQSSLDYFSSKVGDTTLFKVNQSVIEPEYQTLLDSQADWIKENSISSVTIEGHADEQGTREYNLALGERRAYSVKSFLTSLGVEDSRISIISYGKEKLQSLENNEKAWAQSRTAITAINP